MMSCRRVYLYEDQGARTFLATSKSAATKEMVAEKESKKTQNIHERESARFILVLLECPHTHHKDATKFLKSYESARGVSKCAGRPPCTQVIALLTRTKAHTNIKIMVHDTSHLSSLSQ